MSECGNEAKVDRNDVPDVGDRPLEAFAETLRLCDLYQQYGLDELGQRQFGPHVTVWRNASVEEGKRVPWFKRQVMNDLGWVVFICNKEYGEIPALTVNEAAALGASITEALAFCKNNP